MAVRNSYFLVSELPKPGTEKAEKLCRKLLDEFKRCKDARKQLEDEVWPNCIAAFHAKRTLPEADGIDWVDTSDRGCTDIRDAVRAMAQATALGLLPRDDTALQAIAQGDNQSDLNDIRDLVISLIKQCDLRGEMEKHALQLFILGTSVIWVTWSRKFRTVKKDKADTLEHLINQEVDASLLTPEFVNRVRFEEMYYNAPEVKCIDISDVYLDPTYDGSPNEMPSMAILVYRTIDDLEDETDSDGNPKYDKKILEELREKTWTYTQIASASLSKLRWEALEHIGLDPHAPGNSDSCIVPVLVFYRPKKKFEGDTYVDCFFEVALTGETEGKMIAAYENPNYGQKCIFIDTFEDWISGSPYGTGIVEHALPALNHKNVVEALALVSQIGSVFPAVSCVADVLPDERTINISPGSVTMIKWRDGVGGNFLNPLLPTLAASAQAGLQNSQWFGQKVLSASGVFGAVQQDPTKNITDAKTATQVNVETTSGSVMRDNLLERITTRTLEPAVNLIYQYGREYLTEDVTFEKMGHGGQAELRKVTRETLNKDRKIVVVGYHGVQNKARELEELREILATLMQGDALQMMPQLMPVVQETLFKLLGRLGVKNLDEYKKDPAEIILNSPVGQQMLQQAQQQGMQMAQQSSNVAPFPGGDDIGGEYVEEFDTIQEAA